MARNSAESEGVAVIGLGRFGASLAMELIEVGVDVIGIDKDPDVVEAMAGRLTHVAEADGTEEDALQQLGVHELDRVVIGVGNDLENSILIASTVVGMGVRRTWAKAVSDIHVRILTKLGIDHVIMPEQDMGRRVAHLVRGRMLDYIELDDGYAFVKTRPPRNVCDVPLADGKLRSKYGITVVGVKRPHGEFTYAEATTVINHDDVIIVSGSRRAVEKFADHA